MHVVAVLALSSLDFSSLAHAAKLTPKGIVDKAMARQLFRAKGAEMTIAMRLRNKAGETRERQLFLRSRRDGRSRTMVRVLAPPRLRGTAFLFLQRTDGDDQFMYMPALKITRRIVGSSKNASFLGSQFTYADLEWSALEHAHYRQLGDRRLGKDDCYQLQATPQAKDSAYRRVVITVRKRDFSMLAVDFFDGHDKLLKVLEVRRIEQVGGLPMATRLKMRNVQNGEVSLLVMGNVKLRDDLGPELFTKEALAGP
ncbi:MAG: outer membrane lipoprotein-sorting protein [Deltaproteobacteria bacterium]|nr:outer membrane lipoprotein-sorting protein [Deltaproteobacteria bacterium]